MARNRKDPLDVLTKHEGRLEGWLRLRNIPPSDVPDLRQEVYRRAVQYLQSREMTEDVGGLLHKIMAGVVSDYFVDKKQSVEGEARLAEEEGPPNPENEVAEREMKEKLDAIIGTFPKRHQAVLRARFEDDLSPAEISASLGIPLATVKRLINNALDACLAAMKKKGITFPLLVPLVDQNRAKNDAQRSAEESIPWRKIFDLAIAAAAGGLIVYLLTRTATPLATFNPIVMSVATTTEGTPAEYSAPGSVLDRDRPFICPEPPAPVLPPPSGRNAQSDPKVDPRPRLLAQAASRAYDQGDFETAKKLASKVGGAFGEELANKGAKKPEP